VLRRAINGPLAPVNRGQPRSLTARRTRTSAARTGQIRAIPKLTVRVRFPSPALNFLPSSLGIMGSSLTALSFRSRVRAMSGPYAIARRAAAAMPRLEMSRVEVAA
jgi:hypothetical protein